MFNTKVFGFRSEGRSLCPSCAERIYGNDLQRYLNAGDFLTFTDNDRRTYAGQGLQCDDCLKWIFQPEDNKDPWWLVDSEPEEHLRLLAPFANFLETLQVDVMNLRNITTR
jgi:hypothetical protein